MSQSVLPPMVPADPPVQVQLQQFAKRYRAASGLGLRMLSKIGTPADSLLERLPTPVRRNLDAATLQALEVSFAAAQKTRTGLPDTSQWITRALSTGAGAAGGFGGLPSALAELPVTTTLILRDVQAIATQYGFDPMQQDTRFDCLQVLASAGPLAEDDNMDLGFVTMRVSLTGASVQGLLRQIAPRLATVLGQKLAAQTVPVLGAVTGAALNYMFTRYYQEMAHISFGLRKLAEDTGHDRAELIERFRQQVQAR